MNSACSQDASHQAWLERMDAETDNGPMWEPFLWLALIVMGVRSILRRRRRGGAELGPLPDVGDAPADAEPMFRPRLDDTGLATYSMVVPARRSRPRSRPSRLPPTDEGRA